MNKEDLPNVVIYVLEDGETYSGAPAIAVEVTQWELDRIEGGEKVYNVVHDWYRRDANGEKKL